VSAVEWYHLRALSTGTSFHDWLMPFLTAIDVSHKGSVGVGHAAPSIGGNGARIAERGAGAGERPGSRRKPPATAVVTRVPRTERALAAALRLLRQCPHLALPHLPPSLSGVQDGCYWQGCHWDASCMCVQVWTRAQQRKQLRLHIQEPRPARAILLWRKSFTHTAAHCCTPRGPWHTGAGVPQPWAAADGGALPVPAREAGQKDAVKRRGGGPPGERPPSSWRMCALRRRMRARGRRARETEKVGGTYAVNGLGVAGSNVRSGQWAGELGAQSRRQVARNGWQWRLVAARSPLSRVRSSKLRWLQPAVVRSGAPQEAPAACRSLPGGAEKCCGPKARAISLSGRQMGPGRVHRSTCCTQKCDLCCMQEHHPLTKMKGGSGRSLSPGMKTKSSCPHQSPLPSALRPVKVAARTVFQNAGRPLARARVARARRCGHLGNSEIGRHGTQGRAAVRGPRQGAGGGVGCSRVQGSRLQTIEYKTLGAYGTARVTRARSGVIGFPLNNE
jgi:hypothetical protein